MRRGRLIVTDANYTLGTIVIPLTDAADWGVFSAMQSYIFAMTSPVLHEAVIMTTIAQGTGRGASGSAPNVSDVTVLVFSSSGERGLRLPLYGAYGIYKIDGITVDPTVTMVANLIAALYGYGTDNDGNPLVQYEYGRRLS